MKKSDENEIYLSSSPHFSDKSSTSGIMLGVIIALLLLCVYGVIIYFILVRNPTVPRDSC
jgi:Na+-translocating ferredoxin:NAD+ oxidoreductase RnfD subunit